MNKLISEWKNKNMLGYILSFSIIVVLILSIMGAYLYHFYYQTIYSDFQSTNQSYLTAIHIRHENDIAAIGDIITQMGLSKTSTEFTLAESPQKSIILEEQLYRYTSVSQFFSQIFFFYHGDNYLYNSTTSISVERFLNSGLILEQTSKDALSSILYKEDSGLHVLPEQNASGYLVEKFNDLQEKTVIYSMTVKPNGNSNMLFLVGAPYYDGLFYTESEDIRESCIIYDGQVILSRGGISPDREALLQRIREASSPQFETTLDGTSYLITLTQGESGLTYCTVQPMEVFQDKIMSGQWGILFVLSLCSIPTSLAIVALFRSLTRRVKAITSLLNEGEKSHYNLEMIEDGIRMLVETNKKTQQENLPFRRTQFISTFIRNEYPDRKTILEEAKKAELTADYGCFAVVLMGNQEHSSENRAHEIMLHLLGQFDHGDGFGIHLISNNQSLFVVYGDDPSSMRELFEEFFSLGKSYSESFVMSVSGFHNDFSDSSNAYLEATSAFDNRFLIDNSRIIYFSDVADKEQFDLLPETYLKRLKNTIRSKNQDEAETVIQDICSFLQSRQPSLLTFRIVCNDIIHMMITEWNASHVNFENIYNVFSLSQCLTIHDFSDILCDICRRLIETKHDTATESSDQIANAMEYMKQHYQNPELNMTTLAEHLNISGVTLAVTFKNAMGISPSDYLAMMRIEQAKRLLTDTEMRVKEVSLAVGYEDDHVFIRRFKKYVGKTPGQFRTESE